jgi:hypothetical protein
MLDGGRLPGSADTAARHAGRDLQATGVHDWHASPQPKRAPFTAPCITGVGRGLIRRWRSRRELLRTTRIFRVGQLDADRGKNKRDGDDRFSGTTRTRPDQMSENRRHHSGLLDEGDEKALRVRASCQTLDLEIRVEPVTPLAFPFQAARGRPWTPRPRRSRRAADVAGPVLIASAAERALRRRRGGVGVPRGGSRRRPQSR